ncbi:MAG: hypothetical protein Q9227_005634 [Pyrenula ochraceoflavens]
MYPIAGDNLDSGQGVEDCGNGSYCCGHPKNCCDYPSQTFQLPAATTVTTIPYTIGSSATASAQSNVSSASSSTAASSSNSKLSVGASAGIGVSVAIVGLALIAGLAWFFLRRRRQQRLHSLHATETDSSGPIRPLELHGSHKKRLSDPSEMPAATEKYFNYNTSEMPAASEKHSDYRSELPSNFSPSELEPSPSTINDKSWLYEVSPTSNELDSRKIEATAVPDKDEYKGREMPAGDPGHATNPVEVEATPKQSP